VTLQRSRRQGISFAAQKLVRSDMRSFLVKHLKRPAIAAAASVLVLRGLTLASRFLLSLLLARMLSPEELGEYGLVTAVLAYALLALGLEFYSYMYREMVPAPPERRVQIIADEAALGGVSFLAIASLSALAVVGGLFSGKLALWFLLILATEHVSLEATRFLVITSRPIKAYMTVFLRGGAWVYALAAVMYLVPSTRSLETVLIAWAFGGFSSVVFAAAAMSSMPWSRLRGRSPDWSWVWQGLKVARPFMVTAAGAQILTYVDRFIIDEFQGREPLGIYTFYSTIAIGLLSLGASVSHQYLPKVIAGYNESPMAYRASLRTFILALAGITIAVTAISGLAIKPLLSLAGLSTYEASVSVFWLMLPGVLLRVLCDVPSYALYAAHADKNLLYCNLSSALVSIALNFLLIPKFGIHGAALSSSLASASLFVGLSYLALKRISADSRVLEPGGATGLPAREQLDR
jgi:O-antigen/teichoic acid export membrane protein